MTVKPIGDPVYEYTCDLCGTIERAKWTPANWESISIALHSGGIGQLQICQECITTSTILFLINKVTSQIPVGVDEQ